MQQKEESLSWQIALGWVIALVLLTVQFAYMLAYSLLTEADHYFRSLHVDPGVPGLQTLSLIACFYAVMPVVVLTLGRRLRAVRWVVMVVAALALVFNILHHLSHVVSGGRPGFAANVPDLTVHFIMLWVVVSSVRWARSRAAATAPRVSRGVPAEPELNAV